MTGDHPWARFLAIRSTMGTSLRSSLSSEEPCKASWHFHGSSSLLKRGEEPRQTVDTISSSADGVNQPFGTLDYMTSSVNSLHETPF
ncbi:hypothetical protein NDU88_006585 [Pleurodeles waltl]|uniref:Uncharacterized protein n=1 Tax=Pleurodeles waltl TaxID=8319 RepID=A0AAV7TY19_PLEWA|nr:hypothetical protein NDU88_006585 [Pleurodeles waltl]